MLKLIESYGKALLIMISCSMIFAVVFLEFPGRGTKGILKVVGKEIDSSLTKTDSDIDGDAYGDYLSGQPIELLVNKSVQSKEEIKAASIFLNAKKVKDIRILRVVYGEEHVLQNDCIREDGTKVCFKMPGIYCLTVYYTDKNDVSAKCHFYIYAR